MRAKRDTTALTGRKKPAQGKERSDAALGHASQNTSSPDGAKENGELSNGWPRVAIKDMADSIQYGHTASAVERKDGPRFLRITDIQDGRVDSDLSRYEVMDGQQRLNTILEFYENALKLTGLKSWSDLNGYTYGQCPPRIQRGLDRRRLSATVLLAENVSSNGKGDSIRREVFERLNTGGQTLNPQELRNSLYSGRFNNLIIDLAGYRLFDEIWGIPPYEDHYNRQEGFISQELASNEYFKRMRDCEIVLRFFALRQPSKIRGAMRAILDTCMKEHANTSEDEAKGLEEVFKECLDISYQVFGDKTFKIRNPKRQWTLSLPLYDGVMIAVERLSARRDSLISNRKKIVNAFQREFEVEKSYEVIVGKPNTAEAVKTRIDLIHNLMRPFA